MIDVKMNREEYIIFVNKKLQVNASPVFLKLSGLASVNIMGLVESTFTEVDVTGKFKILSKMKKIMEEADIFEFGLCPSWSGAIRIQIRLAKAIVSALKVVGPKEVGSNESKQIILNALSSMERNQEDLEEEEYSEIYNSLNGQDFGSFRKHFSRLFLTTIRRMEDTPEEERKRLFDPSKKDILEEVKEETKKDMLEETKKGKMILKEIGVSGPGAIVGYLKSKGYNVSFLDSYVATPAEIPVESQTKTSSPKGEYSVVEIQHKEELFSDYCKRDTRDNSEFTSILSIFKDEDDNLDPRYIENTEMSAYKLLHLVFYSLKEKGIVKDFFENEEFKEKFFPSLHSYYLFRNGGPAGKFPFLVHEETFRQLLDCELNSKNGKLF